MKNVVCLSGHTPAEKFFTPGGSWVKKGSSNGRYKHSDGTIFDWNLCKVCGTYYCIITDKKKKYLTSRLEVLKRGLSQIPKDGLERLKNKIEEGKPIHMGEAIVYSMSMEYG